jgi:CBS domain-containing protein
VHRIPVVDPATNQLVSVITQSAMVKFITKHLDQLDAGIDATLEQLHLGMKKVFSVNCEDRTLDALQMMQQHDISGIAVLDEQGKIMGNVSVSDVKVLVDADAAGAQLASGPVAQFVSHVRQLELATRYPSISVRATATLRQTLSKLVATGIHRIYVVDDQQRPVGVVSLTDVLKVLTKE